MDKHTLRQYRAILVEIDELEAEKQAVLDQYLAPAPISGMPINHNNNDRIGDVVSRRDKYQKLIDEKIDELIALRVAIEEAIDVLEADERRIIRLRYIDGKRWEQIAIDLHYSIQHIWRLHGIILQKIKDER